MNIQKLLEDFKIPYSSTSDGWANANCCWCDDPSLHMGIHENKAVHCWRCGTHTLFDTIALLLSVDQLTARRIIAQYGGKGPSHPVVLSEMQPPKSSLLAFQFPTNTGRLFPHHKQYLVARGYDPDKLEHEWGLIGTGPTALLENIDYKHRIIAPIKWKISGDYKHVSFQSRDITGKAKRKYLACPKNRERVHHKHLLYGKPHAWGETGICVEGITDVWRLGPAAFAIFGIEYTTIQLQIIAQNFKRVIVIFDFETQAQQQATRMINELHFHGVSAMKMQIKDDPGNMKQADADYLVRNLLK